ncbi:hypothetical protein C8J56DRAFT_1173386 [Mycena floridula]|nr:hypothetical protein C8J56DRAFT_1173386 [Mycena floridula]
MSSWRHIRWSLCRGDKLVVRIFEFEFVLYDSSPQLTNTGFLIGDIVVRVREDSYGHSSSRISHTTHLRTSPTFILPTTTSTSPASPSPFGTAILTIRYVTNPDFRVDEKEGFVVLIIASQSGVTWDDVDVEFTVFTSFAVEFGLAAIPSRYVRFTIPSWASSLSVGLPSLQGLRDLSESSRRDGSVSRPEASISRPGRDALQSSELTVYLIHPPHCINAHDIFGSMSCFTMDDSRFQPLVNTGKVLFKAGNLEGQIRKIELMSCYIMLQFPGQLV